MSDEQKDTFNFEDDAGKGSEDVTAQDLQWPFLYILQTNNPELKEDNLKYVESARPGRIFNSKSQQCYKECHVQPIRMKSYDVEWKANRGGFVGIHEPGELKDLWRDSMAKPAQSLKRKSGNVVTQTYYILVRLEEEDWEPTIMRLVSTQRKAAQQWFTKMSALKMIGRSGKSFNPAYYSTIYTLSVISESNQEGSWYGWKVDKSRSLIEATRTIGNQAVPGPWFVDDEAEKLYLSAREIHEKMVDFVPRLQLPLFTPDDEQNGDTFVNGSKKDDIPF